MPFNVTFIAQTTTDAHQHIEDDVQAKRIPEAVASYVILALASLEAKNDNKPAGPVSVHASGYLPGDPTPAITCNVEVKKMEFR